MTTTTDITFLDPATATGKWVLQTESSHYLVDVDAKTASRFHSGTNKFDCDGDTLKVDAFGPIAVGLPVVMRHGDMVRRTTLVKSIFAA